MKNKLFRYVISAISLALAFTALVGCSLTSGQGEAKKEESITAVVLALGVHANSRDLNLNSPLIKDTVSEAISSLGFVSVISIDGSPDLVAADNYEVPEQYRGNPQLLQDISKKKTANLLAGLSEVRANDAEVDTLEALRLGVRTLASAPKDAQKIIIIVDTGLSTIGFLDFRNNLINGDPQTIADLLAQKQAIPDFTGITVRWQQLGDVNEPQQGLSPAQTKKLEEIWRAIIERTGGTFEPSLTVANPGTVNGELPAVSAVKLPPDEPIKFDSAAVANFEKPQFLSEEQVQFIGDSDQYLNENEAVAVITPIADYMKANPDFTMLLIGTTAGDSNSDYCLDLSERRANTVKNTLVSLDVSTDHVLTVGLGSADPWHIYNAGYEGALAAQNRKVVLLDATTELAKEILGQ